MRFSILLSTALTVASSLIRVNDKNFKDVVVNSGKFTLVDFYADWCRHCMKLMPTIDELAELYADIPEVQIVKINGDEDGRKMTRKYKIDGFPMLYMFHGDDEPVQFEGRRDLDSISNFVQSVSGVRLVKEEPVEEAEFAGPTNVIAVNDENFQDVVLHANHKTIVAFTAPWCKYCQQFKPVFSQLANLIFSADHESVKFAEVDISDENKPHVAKIVGQFGISSLPTILLFDPSQISEDGLKRPVPFTEERTLENLLAFVNENTGLSRSETGELTSEAGRVRHLDEAIRAFSKDSGDGFVEKVGALKESVEKYGREALVDKEEIWFRDDVSMIPYYGKIAMKIASGDVEFVTRELARLQRIVSKNVRDLEKSSRDYMQKRINILKAYVGKEQ